VADYVAANRAAPPVQAHFARHIAFARAGSAVRVAEAPTVDAIEAIIDAAFWASLRREEGYVPKISLALLAPQHASRPLLFERPLPLLTSALVRVAPAVERPGVHLGVWKEDGEMRVWGTTRTVPSFSFVLEVAAPGLLVVKHHRGETGKYVNVAVLEGDQIKIIDESASSLPDCPALLSSLLGFDTPKSWGTHSINILVEMAVSMRRHGRGGTLLVVSRSSDVWHESIVRPVPYAVSPAFSELADLARHPVDDRKRRWQDALTDAIDLMAGLTAVDGATVITEQYDLLAFGAKITRRSAHPLVEQVMATEPIEGGVPVVVHPSRLGGTRHLSAAQFIQDQQNGLALVASQDGRFTVFAWSPCENMVHAHRVETLLL
jgi:hypothetical protein